jgi:hypothetical protein
MAAMEDLRGMPLGVIVLVGFGLLLLAALGLTLPIVINQAIDAPVSPAGILWMLLIAYLVFTLTLVIQRKQAAWNLSLGMASLVVPVTLILWQWASVAGALAGIALGLLLFLSIRGGRVRAWFSQP